MVSKYILPNESQVSSFKVLTWYPNCNDIFVLKERYIFLNCLSFNSYVMIKQDLKISPNNRNWSDTIHIGDFLIHVQCTLILFIVY